MADPLDKYMETNDIQTQSNYHLEPTNQEHIEVTIQRDYNNARGNAVDTTDIKACTTKIILGGTTTANNIPNHSTNQPPSSIRSVIKYCGFPSHNRTRSSQN